MPRRLRLLGTAVLVAALLGACSGDGTDENGAGGTGSGSGSAEAGGHGGNSPFGSPMAPETVSVEDVARLGDGPAVGETFTGVLGLNVCGRFLEPPTAVNPPSGGYALDAGGGFTLAPTTEAEAGDRATLAALLATAGIGLSTGELTLPATVSPGQLDVRGAAPMELAGATLRTGGTCGTTRATVQLWVYTADAAETGTAVRVVVTDPQDVPVVEDGMVFVVAFSPESSLPTLPPSALAR